MINVKERLQHPDSSVRRGAVRDLLHSNAQNKLIVLAQVIKRETDPRLKGEFQRALERLEGRQKKNQSLKPEQIQKVLSNLDSEDSRVQKQGLHWIVKNQRLDLLDQVLERRELGTDYKIAALQLMQLDGARYFRKVVSLLNDREAPVAIRAVELLSNIGHTPALITVLKALDHPVQKVREFVRRRLLSLGDARLGQLFEELIGRQEESFDQLLFRSVIQLRFVDAVPILKTLQQRAKGELRTNLDRVLEKLTDSQLQTEATAEKSFSGSDIERQIRNTNDAGQLLSLLRALPESEVPSQAQLRILMQHMSHPSQVVRLASLEVFVSSMSPSMLSIVSPFLQSDDLEIRTRALCGFGQRCYEQFEREIISSMRELLSQATYTSLDSFLSCSRSIYRKEILVLLEELIQIQGLPEDFVFQANEIYREISGKNLKETDPKESANILGSEQFQDTSSGERGLKEVEQILTDSGPKELKLEILREIMNFELSLDSTELSQLLKRALAFEEEEEVVLLLLHACTMFSSSKGADFAVPFMKHESSAVQSAAIQAMIDLKDQRILLHFHEWLQDSMKSDKVNYQFFDSCIETVLYFRQDLAYQGLVFIGEKGALHEERILHVLSNWDHPTSELKELLLHWMKGDFDQEFKLELAYHLRNWVQGWEALGIARIVAGLPDGQGKDLLLEKLQEFDVDLNSLGIESPKGSQTRGLEKPEKGEGSKAQVKSEGELESEVIEKRDEELSGPAPESSEDISPAPGKITSEVISKESMEVSITGQRGFKIPRGALAVAGVALVIGLGGGTYFFLSSGTPQSTSPAVSSMAKKTKKASPSKQKVAPSREKVISSRQQDSAFGQKKGSSSSPGSQTKLATQAKQSRKRGKAQKNSTEDLAMVTPSTETLNQSTSEVPTKGASLRTKAVFVTQLKPGFARFSANSILYIGRLEKQSYLSLSSGQSVEIQGIVEGVSEYGSVVIGNLKLSTCKEGTQKLKS